MLLLLGPSTDDAKPAIRGKHLRIIVERPVYSRTTGTQKHPYGEVERVQQYTLDLNLLCFFILKLNTLDAHPELPPPPQGSAPAVILSLLCCSCFSYFSPTVLQSQSRVRRLLHSAMPVSSTTRVAYTETLTYLVQIPEH